MSVYNELPYLSKAVQSVLDQTFEDFEFIIVNDGSTDGSGELLERFSVADKRIWLVHQENRGLPASLNRGLRMAEGRYVARMDADDISHPERFKRQVRFLDTNPQIGIVGTQIEKMDSQDRVRWKWSPPTHPDVIAWRLFFDTCFCHPTVMARRSLLEELGGYAEWAEVGQDYELWTRAVLETRLANLPSRLYKARRHGDSATVTDRREQIKTWSEAAATLHRAVLGNSAEDQMASFLLWLETSGVEKAVKETGMKDFCRVHEYLCSLYEACTQRFFTSGSNIQVLRRALRKLDTIANQVLKGGEWKAGMMCKRQSWSIVSAGEFLPLVWAVFRSRIDRNFRFSLN
jgi:glycosyltransferase involved in cell wall biosynthesis